MILSVRGLNEKSDWELTFSTKSSGAKYENNKTITEENILNALKHSKDDIENLKESLGPYDGQLNLTESLSTVYNFGGWGGSLLDSGFDSSYKNIEILTKVLLIIIDKIEEFEANENTEVNTTGLSDKQLSERNQAIIEPKTVIQKLYERFYKNRR